MHPLSGVPESPLDNTSTILTQRRSETRFLTHCPTLTLIIKSPLPKVTGNLPWKSFKSNHPCLQRVDSRRNSKSAAIDWEYDSESDSDSDRHRSRTIPEGRSKLMCDLCKIAKTQNLKIQRFEPLAGGANNVGMYLQEKKVHLKKSPGVTVISSN